MDDLFLNILVVNDQLVQNYNLDISIFFIIYLISFIPFYLGYILMLFGSTRNLEWNDVLNFRIKNKLQWNGQSKLGLCVHLFGRIVPYLYIISFGRDLPIWFYFVILLIIILAVWLFIRKLVFVRDTIRDDIRILNLNVINDDREIEELWSIYNHTFEKVNILSPCKQSFDREEFVKVLKDATVCKYVVQGKDGKIIGIGLVTNNFINTPWISKDYFKYNFPFEFSKGLIYYFMGLAIGDGYRGNKYSIRLIEYIFDDLPIDSIVGFDHSRNINPLLHHFTRIIKQSGKIRRNHIDKQHYHVVRKK